MLILMLLALPVTHTYYYLYLLIPFLYAVSLLAKKEKINIDQIVFLAMAYCLVFFINPKELIYFDKTAELVASGASVFGTIILLIILVQLQKKDELIKKSSWQKMLYRIISYGLLIVMIFLYGIGLVNHQLVASENKTNSIAPPPGLISRVINQSVATGNIETGQYSQSLDKFYSSKNASYYEEYGFIHPKKIGDISEVRYKFSLPGNLVSVRIKSVFYVINDNNYIKLYASQDDISYRKIYDWKYLKGRKTSGAEINLSTHDNKLPLYIKVEMHADKNTSVANIDTRLQQLELITFTKKQ